MFKMRILAFVIALEAISVRAQAQVEKSEVAPDRRCARELSSPIPRARATWGTGDDYPDAALRAEEEGSVRYRAHVSAAGRVEKVEILETSAPQRLVSRTEEILMRRGRFVPAMRNCEAVPGEFEDTFVWKIPR